VDYGKFKPSEFVPFDQVWRLERPSGALTAHMLAREIHGESFGVSELHSLLVASIEGFSYRCWTQKIFMQGQSAPRRLQSPSFH